jgi:hypothetical protein
MRDKMTEKEVQELEYLCNGFSSLSEDHKQFALTVSQALLTMQNSQGHMKPKKIMGLSKVRGRSDTERNILSGGLDEKNVF